MTQPNVVAPDTARLECANPMPTIHLELDAQTARRSAQRIAHGFSNQSSWPTFFLPICQAAITLLPLMCDGSTILAVRTNGL